MFFRTQKLTKGSKLQPKHGIVLGEIFGEFDFEIFVGKEIIFFKINLNLLVSLIGLGWSAWLAAYIWILFWNELKTQIHFFIKKTSNFILSW